MTEPDDRELQDYLKGDGRLSRAYRQASAETVPPELDEAILARARAEARRKPDWGRALAPYALAASVLLGVNLAWNVYQEQPLQEPPVPVSVPDAAPAVVATVEQKAEAVAAPPAPEPVAAKRHAPPAAAPVESNPPADAATAPVLAEAAREESGQRKALAQASRAAPEAFANMADVASAPAAGSSAGTASLSEAEKIDRLLDYVATLSGAVFIRNGSEHAPADAAEHLQMKRRKAGDRVRTADDFIRLCASASSTSGEPYRIRFADGRLELAEAVLRARLAELER